MTKSTYTYSDKAADVALTVTGGIVVIGFGAVAAVTAVVGTCGMVTALTVIRAWDKQFDKERIALITSILQTYGPRTSEQIADLCAGKIPRRVVEYMLPMMLSRRLVFVHGTDVNWPRWRERRDCMDRVYAVAT